MTKRKEHIALQEEWWEGEKLSKDIYTAYPKIKEAKLEIKYHNRLKDIGYPEGEGRDWHPIRIFPEYKCDCGKGTWRVEDDIRALYYRKQNSGQGYVRCTNSNCNLISEYRISIEYQ